MDMNVQSYGDLCAKLARRRTEKVEMIGDREMNCLGKMCFGVWACVEADM